MTTYKANNEEDSMNTKNLKPFDLESALNGEPVMLRDGSKAYVRHHETELRVPVGEELTGYVEGIGTWAWREDGASRFDDCESEYDIIGMWPKTRIINGFEVPAPVREELEVGDMYFTPSIGFEGFHDVWEWGNTKLHKLYLERGLIFLKKEDAIANAKAMLGIGPYEECKE